MSRVRLMRLETVSYFLEIFFILPFRRPYLAGTLKYDFLLSGVIHPFYRGVSSAVGSSYKA